MAVKMNSEFNYKFQVQGETIWEKIKTLQGFLEGRKRAAVLEEVQSLKTRAKVSKLEHLRATGGLEHEMLELEAEIIEIRSFEEDQKKCWELNRDEIKMLNRLLDEAYAIAEPTRIKHPDGTPFTDEEMFEANACNEFTAMIGKEIHAEILANGHPSPAKIRNAMSNPTTWQALIQCGLIPEGNQVMLVSNDPMSVVMRLPNANEVKALTDGTAKQD